MLTNKVPCNILYVTVCVILIAMSCYCIDPSLCPAEQQRISSYRSCRRPWKTASRPSLSIPAMPEHLDEWGMLIAGFVYSGMEWE